MKIVQNTSMQGLKVSFTTPTGRQSLFFASKEIKEIPDSWSSKRLINLIERRMFTMKQVAQPAQPVVQAPARKYKKKESN